MPDSIHALVGIAGLLGLAWLLSEKRFAVPWRAVAVGLILQLILAVLFLRAPYVKDAFLKLNDALLLLERATQAGTGFVFGYLGGGPAPFAVTVGGMASIAGTVLFLYGSILRPTVPDAVAHLLIASILSAPAALVIAFLMVPPEGAATGGAIELRSEASGSMDALTRGTLEGAQLLLNIVAMLVVFVALVALINLVIAPYTLQGALGWALAPLAWLAGIPWHEARAAGALLGTKTVINELVAYIELSKLAELSERSRLLLTYALCGFANFGSLGIMIGGLGTMCPERRAEVVALGLKSIVAGTLATCLTAASVALIL